MKQKHMLGVAIALAATKFGTTTDRGGEPYMLHCLKVMEGLNEKDHELRAIGVMHDVVEDTDVTLDDLANMGFSFRVVNGVDGMTKRENETYEDFVRRCATNEDSRLAKIEDLKHNSDITRLKGIGKKDIERMEKYHRAYLYLIGV